MRKVMVWGFVLVAVALLFTGVQAQRLVPFQDAPTKTASPVEVVNFPAVQTVGGSVNVGGAVQVTNLPLDEGGRVLVSVPAIQFGNAALVLRSTAATYQGNLGGRTGATQKCRAEFANSHFPSQQEIQQAISTRGIAWLSSETDWSWVDVYFDSSRSCGEWLATTNPDGSRNDGLLVRTKGTDLFNGGPCSDAHPVLCAE